MCQTYMPDVYDTVLNEALEDEIQRKITSKILLRKLPQ